MKKMLAGRIAIVTGGSKGIGRAIAKALAEAGATVVVSSRDGSSADLRTLVDDIVATGARAFGVIGDVRSPKDTQHLVETTVSVYGRLDILVNNAGIYFPGTPLQGLDPAALDETIDTNLRGTLLCCKYALPHLIAAGGGSIINLGSSASDVRPGQIGNVVYAAAKSAVVRLTQVLAEEVAAHDIAVNCIQPMSLLTESVKRSAQGIASIDLGAFAPPESIGPAIVYLARQRAGFSGHVVRRTDFDGERFVKTF
jgi:NAD(P)-dependent dehydrogenase (short-subunit alcohol dehydrogenase family)